MNKKRPAIYLFFLSLVWLISAHADNLPISLFPLDNYDQNVDRWLSPADPQYKKPLLDAAYQKARLQQFHNRMFSTSDEASSPWSQRFVSAVLNKNPGVLPFLKASFTAYSNKNKSEKTIGYGENFRPHDAAWITNILNNIELKQFALPIRYQPNNRAIVIKNTLARVLPTRDPHFYSYKIPGQGYPFDNLQASALWMGAPVYVIGKTKDAAWSLVLSSSFIAWVESNALATANTAFVTRWEKSAQQALAAVTQTESPVLNASNKKYQFAAYVGSVFPLLKEGESYLKIQIPQRNNEGMATVSEAFIDTKYATKMPLAATPENFSRVMKTLQNRPYGWGNTNFYNDCSAELQSLYTPFGIWLPRNSSQQSMAGKALDLGASSQEKRLAYLMENGRPLLTIVGISGHIFMYLGNYPNPNSKDHAPMAMSYQNVWGISPKDGSRRAIFGQSALLPLLNTYPEDPTLNPFTNTKRFVVIYLDQWSDAKKKDTDLFF